jgi:hypothetical protein
MAHGKSLRQIKAEKKQASKEMHRANKASTQLGFVRALSMCETS